jgi:lysophospholipase L1-like esterase
MKKYVFLILLILSSVLLSVVLIFLVTETFFRVQKKGFIDGIKSYFVVETPYSALGTNDWVIYDSELGYRQNPALPEINEYSMRNDEIVMPKPTGSKRIVILGDSLPYSGYPNFVTMLREKFAYDKNIEIINASTPGYTNYQELVFLKKYILKIEPDLVILNYVLNDNFKFLHKFDEKEGMLYTDEARESLKINNNFEKIVSKSYFLSRLKLASLNREANLDDSDTCFENHIDFNTAWKDESWPDIDHQLEEMNSLLKKQNSKLSVVIFPLECQVKSDFLSENFNHITKPQQKVLEYGKKYDIKTLDLFMPFYTAIDKNKEISLYTDGIHLTENGHSLSAEEISKFINENFINF